MQTVSGVIAAFQEGRFKLDRDDGRSQLFVLDRHAAIEPQDLLPLATRPLRVTVRYSDGKGSRQAIAHELRLVEEAG